ncbi:MAG TPA: hypothetical protein PLY96_11995 [Chromatiaceae bacterium]|nr:hypothetical protein [Chromatiaceae bacterium]
MQLQSSTPDSHADLTPSGPPEADPGARQPEWPGEHPDSGRDSAAWPAWLVAGMAGIFVAVQFLWLPAVARVDLSALIAETLICMVPLASLFVVQRLRQSPRIFWPMMAGLSCLLFSHLADALDEVRVQPELIGILVEDGLAVLGFSFLVLGLVRWARFNQPIVEEIRALNAGLEARVAARTATLEAVMTKRQRAKERLRASEQRYRRLNATLEQRVEERTAEVQAANTLLREQEAGLQASHQRLMSILNAMDAKIYLADRETHELLFMNPSLIQVFGQVEGQRCYQVLQGRDAPCPFCTNDRLVDAAGNPTGVYAWEFQNERNQHWYDLRDCAVPWTDGRLVRMEVATDITARKHNEIHLILLCQIDLTTYSRKDHV